MTRQHFIPPQRATAFFVGVLLCSSPVSSAADAQAGRNKAQVCVACHGPGGNSVVPTMPSLAGQPKQFITTQLVMFREGNRKDPQMSPIAANLSNADMNDLAEYFSREPLTPSARRADAANTTAGQRLTAEYHCVSCHGPALQGQQHIPRIAGQQRDYLLKQLQGFKAGTRFDMDGNMTAAVQALPVSAVTILADYLSALK
ncbi:MAG: c-type cytochrome [Burkholderiales bacterium]